jgi:hypothetical protein
MLLTAAVTIVLTIAFIISITTAPNGVIEPDDSSVGYEICALDEISGIPFKEALAEPFSSGMTLIIKQFQNGFVKIYKLGGEQFNREYFIGWIKLHEDNNLIIWPTPFDFD